MRRTLATAITVVLAAVVARAQPARVDVDGQPLSRRAVATRSRLFGLVELYRVALYTPRDGSGLATFRNSARPKAIRIEIVYQGSLPKRIPDAWTRELLPVLDWRQQDQLRRAYAQLKPDDSVSVEYVPSRGTTVSISGRRILVDVGQQLIAAFLDVWVGQTPVSEEMKQELLQELR